MLQCIFGIGKQRARVEEEPATGEGLDHIRRWSVWRSGRPEAAAEGRLGKHADTGPVGDATLSAAHYWDGGGVCKVNSLAPYKTGPPGRADWPCPAGHPSVWGVCKFSVCKISQDPGQTMRAVTVYTISIADALSSELSRPGWYYYEHLFR